MKKISVKKISKAELKQALRKKWIQFKEWRAERKDRCVLYRIYEDQEKDCIVRYRDKRFHKSDLPSTAVPVTGERNAWAIVTLSEPPPAPYGQNAITLFIWSEDYSFERSFEHFSSSDGPGIDWKKILIGGAVVIAGLYIMMTSGVIG